MRATGTPAASNAAIFSAAVPLPPEMIAPAWPMRLPGRRGLAGDERHHRLAHVALDELRRLLLVAAADLADQHDRLGVRVGLEQRQRVDEVGADHRVAADAEAGGLPEPGLGELVHDLVGERAAARHDADRPGRADVPGQDADLGLARA